MDNYAVKLFESLQKLKVTDENKEEVEKIKQDIRNKNFKKALERIEKIQYWADSMGEESFGRILKAIMPLIKKLIKEVEKRKK